MPRQVSGGGEALKKLVWDLPTRLVHWLLVALIAFSWWSVHYDHINWHIWSGCAILALLIFRLLWGLVGSSTARFASFVKGPRAIADHWRGKWIGMGHNPLGALSVLALLAALALQVGLGLIAQDEDGLYLGPLAQLVRTETSDKAREIHSLWFNVILGLIALHLAAIIWYRIRGRKLTLPMITGRAEVDPAAPEIERGRWWAALVCLALAISLTRWIIAGVPPFGS